MRAENFPPNKAFSLESTSMNNSYLQQRYEECYHSEGSAVSARESVITYSCYITRSSFVDSGIYTSLQHAAGLLQCHF